MTSIGHVLQGNERFCTWPLYARVMAGALLGIAVGEAFGRRGLWGGFGWLYTSKGLLGLYVSRTDRVVLVRLRTGRPLLVTPEDDERFVAALRDVSRG